MIHTEIFRLYPSDWQIAKLNEIFTIYNRAKRIGYTFLLKRSRKKGKIIVFEGEKETQHKLMEFCHNNPYVGTIIIDIKTRIKQQETWLKKNYMYLKNKINKIKGKINKVKSKDKKDRRLQGLYARLHSLQNKVNNLESSLQEEYMNARVKPVVFGTKQLFRKRILHKMGKKEFRIRRDASFGCVGKKQYGRKNLNIKVLLDKKVRVRTFSKEKGKKWVIIPFFVNKKQENRFKELLDVDKYTAIVKRKFVKNELRYYLHVSYDRPEPEITYSFENGAIGLDFNYNFASLTNIDENGKLLSYETINFRNLHNYRRNKRNDYISFKLDKIINYCINKQKGIVIEKLSLKQNFSYNKILNRKLSNFKSSALELLKRKCIKNGVDVREVHPAYTSIIGHLKYSRLFNLSTHTLASYGIARRGLGFKEAIPPIYKWVLSQVGDAIKPRLKKTQPYYEWSKIHDLFKQSGITSFETSEIVKQSILMKNVLNSCKSAQPDNLKAGLSKSGKINDYHKFWKYLNNFQSL